MTITSSAFLHNQPMPAKYTCEGENVNPPLQFADIPANAQSVALIVDDEYAPGKIWSHWILFNMPPSLTQIEENHIPVGVKQGITDFENTRYDGPCPPSGNHIYRFHLFALDVMLEDMAHVTQAMLQEAMKGHILEEAVLNGTYQRA